MSEIVNLRRARKAKARIDAEKNAAANRVAHGRAKAEKNAAKAESEAASKRLDGHKRDPDA